MNDPLPPLQIRIFGIDGSTRTFTENDLRVTTHVLAKLNPAKFFADDTVNIISGDSEFTLSAAGLARIELITDRLSVWDFPFIMGAHIELTEDEFRECLDYAQQRETADRLSDLPVFVEVTMVKGQRYHFWMEVVGGLSNLRVSRIHSLLKGGHLIFGLRNGGVGVLNL
ncbi:MAG TPA: hypothetical protein VL970_11345, partial [Candidatus Acidoferrales bacterium]|nr:hypothetical protein [Candidatus Acidoferrales bacterium]